MQSPIGLWRRLRSLRARADLESGLDDEIRFHLDQQIAKNIKNGMNPEAARRAALVRFGGVERAKESTRDEFRAALLEDLARDFRYGARTLMRAPGFALVSVLTLGLGIGAATAVFSVVHGVLLRPLPYPEADRIVRLWQLDKDGNRSNASEPNFNDWKSQSRSFQAMAEVLWRGSQSVVGAFEPNRALVATVSREFFDVLRVRPALGRSFVPEEQRQGAAAVALISDSYWKRWLAGRTDVTRETLRFGDRVYQIVGVMPAGFDYPFGAEIWTPRELEPPNESRTSHSSAVIARLGDGTALEQAQQELSGISRALKARYGEDTWMSDADLVGLQDQITEPVRPALYVLLVAAAFLLVIACANVSNLLLARAATRARELAVRLALGAGRSRVTRQLMAESLVLCVAGGAAGVFLAFAGVKGLLAFEPGNLPRIGEVSVNFTALAFALGVSFTIAILLGLATTVRVGRRDLRGYLSEAQRTTVGTRGSQRVRDALVVAQVALTLVLLIGAGLLGRSFLRILAVDPGYRTDNILVLDLSLAPATDRAMEARQLRFYDDLMQRLRALRGVTTVAGTTGFPLGNGFFPNGQFIEMSRPDEIQTFEDYNRLMDVQTRAGFAGYRVVSEDYFRALRIRLIRGRVFDSSDASDAPHVAVISESLVRTKWPNQDPIGKFVQFGNMDGDTRGFRIVGIVSDVREISPESPPGSLFYGFHRQRTGATNTFSILVQGPRAGSLAADAQRVVRELNPDLPVRTSTVEEALDRSLAGRRFSLILLVVFGAAALVLATMGIYGVISYLVAQRSREIGIRMALGASHTDLFGLIIGRGARLALIGTTLGLVAALALTRLLSGLLFGVSATDPAAFGAVIVLIAGSVMVASYLPARRAIRIAPNVTLRTE